jgi:hypothetical protein
MISDAFIELRKVATNETRHVYMGLRPDELEGHNSRDPDCPTCQAIANAEAHAGRGSLIRRQSNHWKVLGVYINLPAGNTNAIGRHHTSCRTRTEREARRTS